MVKESKLPSRIKNKMTLLNIPTMELMELCGELLEAYHGVNGYGSDTCELYAFRFGKLKEKESFKKEVEKSKFEARDNLFELLEMFKKSYSCDFVFIFDRFNDAVNLTGLQKIKDVWMQQGGGFEHRCHIKVIKK